MMMVCNREHNLHHTDLFSLVLSEKKQPAIEKSKKEEQPDTDKKEDEKEASKEGEKKASKEEGKDYGAEGKR